MKISLQILNNPNITYLKCISFYLLILKAKKKGIFFKYTKKDISKFLKLSPHITRTYLKKCLDLKLLYIHSDNICVSPQPKGYRLKIEVTNFQNTIHNIQKALFENNLRRQQYMIKAKSAFYKQKIDRKIYRHALKAYRKGYITDVQDGRFCQSYKLGYRRLSQLTGVNVSKCKDFLFNMIREKVILEFNSRRFYMKDKLARISCTQYSILPVVR